MASYGEVFARTEKKFRITQAQRQRIEKALLEHMQPDDYGRSLITSLYLDTPDRSLISRSTEKPLYKEKIRVRAYGTVAGGELMRTVARWDAQPSSAGSGAPDDLDCVVFVEMKKKFKGVVYKRRVSLSPQGARAYLCGATYEQAQATYPIGNAAYAKEAASARSLQIAREIEALMARHGQPDPSMGIACERVAWKPFGTTEASGRGWSDLRVTFDDGLSCCDLAHGDGHWDPIIASDESIMEIKNSGPIPLWLTRELSSCKAYAAAFSKYGTAYRLSWKEHHHA